MPELEFTNLLLVAVAAFVAPFALGLVPWLRFPAIVVEIVLGVVLGPDVLGWVEVDEVVAVMSLLGLAFLLFLAGLEIDLRRLAGRPLELAAAGFVISVALALAAGIALQAAGLTRSALLVGVALLGTGLGIVLPPLKDAGALETRTGQLVIASATIAEFGSIVLLTLLFSAEGASTGSQALLLGGFVLLIGVVGLAVVEIEHSRRAADILLRLQDTTAQIRVRGAFVLLVAFVALAEGLGLEAILGAFVAGALLSALDRDRMMTHTRFREKLEAAGFGVFVPVFFVASGVRFDLAGLLADAGTLALVPLFLLAILLVRGLPSLILWPSIGRESIPAGVLSATASLGFLVAAAEIGIELDLITAATGAALIGAGLLSILIFPLVGLAMLQAGRVAPARSAAAVAADDASA